MVLVHDDDLAHIAGSSDRIVSGHPYISCVVSLLISVLTGYASTRCTDDSPQNVPAGDNADSVR
jgi:hypothetical protein